MGKEESTAGSETLTLRGKLALARKAAKAVEKRGRNERHNYDYVRAEDVMREAERVLAEQNVLVIPEAMDATEIMGNGMMLRVNLIYEVTDADTGESFHKKWIAYGYDKPGDKAIYKALTGGEKYFLARLLGIPFGDDPENDDGGDPQAPQQSQAAQKPKGKAQAKRRDGQGDGRTPQASAAQRRKIHSEASRLQFQEHELKAWLEFTGGTPHTDRLEKQQASELIDKLGGYGSKADALAAFGAALEQDDERAARIASKHKAPDDGQSLPEAEKEGDADGAKAAS